MRRLCFDVAYDGTDFHGWQVQPGLPTIQATLEEVISQVEGKPVRVAGSGRTDTGVHALAQVAAVTLDNPIPTDNFRRAVNRLLPLTVRIDSVREAPPNFHPRFHAKRKTYEYRIFRGEVCSPFERRFIHHYPYPLDERSMIAAARLLEGQHDFAAFAARDKKDCVQPSKVRILYRSFLHWEGERLIYSVTGSGFLKHMVRNIVGILIEIGKGNITEAELQAMLAPGCAVRPGSTVPGSGLFLVSVEYA